MQALVWMKMSMNLSQELNGIMTVLRSYDSAIKDVISNVEVPGCLAGACVNRERRVIARIGRLNTEVNRPLEVFEKKMLEIETEIESLKKGGDND